MSKMIPLEMRIATDNWQCSLCGKVCSNISGFSNHMRKVHGVVGVGKIAVICDECGKAFQRKPSHVRRGDHHYCSIRCAANATRGSNSYRWNGGPIERKCKVCKKTFLARQNEIKLGRAHFCSRKCAGIGQRGTKSPNWKGGEIKCVCEVCGNIFFVPQSSVRQGGGRFCSKKCFGIETRGSNHHNWRGCPDVHYGIGWSRQQTLCRARDNNTCQLCGVTNGDVDQELDVHHIIPFRISHDNTLSNLVLLCRKCHSYCEWNPEDCPIPRKHWLLTA